MDYILPIETYLFCDTLRKNRSPPQISSRKHFIIKALKFSLHSPSEPTVPHTLANFKCLKSVLVDFSPSVYQPPSVYQLQKSFSSNLLANMCLHIVVFIPTVTHTTIEWESRFHAVNLDIVSSLCIDLNFNQVATF